MNSQNLRPYLEQSLEHRSLASLKGFWKVVHHGNLITAVAPEKTPRLVIYFRQLVNQDKPTTRADFETQGTAVPIIVPAAELMRLPLNVVINNSRLAIDPCMPLPSEDILELDVDISESTTTFINRYRRHEDTADFIDPHSGEVFRLDNSRSGHYIIPYHEGRTPDPESAGGRAYYVAIEHNDDPYGILIPCAEIFRFFYCTSSRMLYTILSDKILDVDRYIIDPARSGRMEGNPNLAVVWLRQWMFNSDRRHIARLLFTDGAFEEAKKIFLRAGGHVDSGKLERALIALPPYHGEMKLKCIFKIFNSRHSKRIFVTRLISAMNWTLPFEAIHFGRDNDSRSVLRGAERDALPDDERHSRPKVLDKDAEISTLVDTSADDSIDPIEIHDAEFESRFPEFDKIHSPQVEKYNQKTKNNQGKKLLLLADGSLVEGSAVGDKGLVNTILHARDEAARIQRENKEKSSTQSEPLQELNIKGITQLHKRIDHLEKARIDGEAGSKSEYAGRLDIQYLRILEQPALLKGVLVNILPDSFDGKSSKWFFIDEQKEHPRPVLVACLTLDGKTRYMIDFMHPEGDKRDAASLLLWHPDEAQMKEHILKYAIHTCIRNRAVNLKDADLLRDYAGYAMKHTSPKVDPKFEHIHLIQKIFSRRDNMTKWTRAFSPQAEDTGSD